MNNLNQRKLSAILFADIVGYTALMQSDEVIANQHLEKFHNTLNTKVTLHQGQVINNYGDGCVCTFDSAVAAMNCAKEVQTIFQTEPKVPVRIGLHSGDVMFKGDNVYGDSVNIASRIESLGVGGAVLFSKQIKRHISNQKEFKVQSLGEFDFKNIEKTMEVFALTNDGFAIPRRSEMKGKVKSKKLKWLVPLALVTLILSTIFIFQAGFFNKKEYQDGEVSLAIMPFRNISNDDTNNHYGIGMASEIRTKLSLSKKFAYLSSLQATSTFVNSNKTPRDIGEELNVDYLLMGMFQIAGDDIKVNIELLDAKSGKSVEEIPQYQDKFSDIFKLQADIANQVLHQFSFFNENETTEKKYEPDVLAYGHYLKGNEILAGDFSMSAFENAIIQYESAIQIDSNYLSAWVGLMIAKTDLLFSFDNSDTLQEEAEAIMNYIETHFSESWKINLARGIYEYHGLGHYEKGLQFFLKVIEKNPENHVANFYIGAIYKRYLLPKNAFYNFAKVKNQNPKSAVIWAEIATMLELQGDLIGAVNMRNTSLKFSDAKVFKDQLFIDAIFSGDMTQIPQTLKTEYRNDYWFYENYFKQNWENCLTILDTTSIWEINHPWFAIKGEGILSKKMEIYFIKNTMDSCSYYAQQLLVFYDQNPNKINTERKAFALSILNRYEESNTLIQSGSFNNGMWIPLPEEDKMMQCERLPIEIKNYIYQKNYKKATSTLLELNARVPSFGNYHTFRTDPFYNQIKKEYPLFAKALAELKLPKLVPFEEALKD